MIKVSIGNDTLDWEHVDQQWLCNQINHRREEGQEPCVRVYIQEPGLDLMLTTPACNGCGGGYRQANSREEHVLELWRKHHLKEKHFTCGNVNAFLQQLRKLI